MTRKYQRRILLHLLIAIPLALFLWYLKGCPLPTAEMEMHQAERRMLAEESRVIWSREYKHALEDIEMLVGVTRDSIHTYATPGYRAIWPRGTDRPTLVPMHRAIRFFTAEGLYSHSEALILVAVDPPPGAETARLTLDLNGLADQYVGDELCYTVQALREGEVFPFFVKKEHDTDFLNSAEDSVFGAPWSMHPEYMDRLSYTLEFYDAGGASVGTYTG